MVRDKLLFFKTIKINVLKEHFIIGRLMFHPPIRTAGNPVTMLPPCAVLSPIRAAGLPPIITVTEPLTIASGGPVQVQVSPTTAAGNPPISTFGTPGPVTGPPTWGIGGTAGVCIGQVCISVNLAAGCPILSVLINHYNRTPYSSLACGGDLRSGVSLGLQANIGIQIHI